MSRQLNTTLTKEIKALLTISKSKLRTWKNIEPIDRPEKEIEALGCQLLDSYLENRTSKLLQIAAELFELINNIAQLSFQGYVAYIEVCILRNDLQTGITALCDIEHFLSGRKQYKSPRTNNLPKDVLFKSLNARLYMRLDMLENHFDTAMEYFDSLDEYSLNRDPHIRVLASICLTRMATGHEDDWEAQARRAIQLVDDYADYFGESFDVFIQRAIAHESLHEFGAAYENFEKAYQWIETIDKKDQLVERTIISLGLWRLLQVQGAFKRIRLKSITPATKSVDRIELLRRSAAEGQWEDLLALTDAIHPADLTISEGLLISFAAIEKGQYRRAREVLEAMGHDDDGNVQRLLNLARLAYVEGDKEKALEYSEKAVAFCISADVSVTMATPIIQMAVHLMHEHAHRNKNYERFIEFLESFPENWKQIEIKILLVQMMMNADTVRHERKYVKRGLRILKSIPAPARKVDWYLLSGRLLMLQEKFDKALKAFKIAGAVVNEAGDSAQTLRLIIDNSIEECERALHENETGEGEGIIGHARLMNQTFVELGLKVHRILQVEEGTMPIAIVERPNNTMPNAHLITLALSFRQASFENLKPAELGMAILKADINSIQPDDWRVRLLATLSQSLQAQKGIRPRMGMSLKNPMGGNLIEGIGFPSVVLFDSWETFIPESSPIALVEVVPVYQEENDFAAMMGSERLLHRLMDVPFYPTKPNRMSSCPGENWKMLIPRDKIRQIYDDHGMFGCVSKHILVDGADSAIFYRDHQDKVGPTDSGWFFLTGNETEEEIHQKDQFAMMDLNTICNYIPYVKDYLEAPFGTACVRDASGVISMTTCDKSAALLQRVNKKPLLA